MKNKQPTIWDVILVFIICFYGVYRVRSHVGPIHLFLWPFVLMLSFMFGSVAIFADITEKLVEIDIYI